MASGFVTSGFVIAPDTAPGGSAGGNHTGGGNGGGGRAGSPGGGAGLAVVVADRHGDHDAGQGHQHHQACGQQWQWSPHNHHGNPIPIPARQVGAGFGEAALGRQRQQRREQCGGGQKSDEYGDGTRRPNPLEDAQASEHTMDANAKATVAAEAKMTRPMLPQAWTMACSEALPCRRCS